MFPPSLKYCVWAEIANRCKSSGHSLLCLLSGSSWMSRGHATRSWLVSPFVQYCLHSLCASSLLRVLVQRSQWDVSSNFVSLHQLGKITRGLHRGVQGTKPKGAGFSSHVGERHLPEKLSGNVGLLQQRS